HDGAGWPTTARSNACWVASIPDVMLTIARCGSPGSGAAGKAGRRDSAQLILSTGLVERHSATRTRQAVGTSEAQSSVVRLGSALETTTAAPISSPPTSRTPTPGSTAATGTPDASTAPCSRAASASANDTRPGAPRPRPQPP